ncbi:8905_t:CDS:2 [Ambispora gerdemannii]|uniref:8905_t:CDS:1 n=1 Tax=Ambispora gerdemannii TaxID=144530 RepID=A0A9N8ZF08_9GLOM|nr:8905_t:CDS:2 [Ambispora gerdemannii]
MTSTHSNVSSTKTRSSVTASNNSKLLSLYEQRRGTSYFIPEGFEPVLIPTNGTQQPPANLLLANKSKKTGNSRNSSSSNNGSNSASSNNNTTMINATPVASSNVGLSNNVDLKFPSLVLTQAKGPAPRGGSVSKANKPKKPPRPPNAFILYRRSKQQSIVAANEGITNNEVSKQVGEMWHKASADEKSHFQQLADAAKMEHMQKYPEYKYRPRRPHEKRRRTKRPSAASLNSTSTSTKDTTQSSDDVVTTISSPFTNDNIDIGVDNSIHEMLFNDMQRRPSIESVSSMEDSTQFDYAFDDDFSRRSSIASTIIDNEMPVMFDMTASSPLTLSPSLESAQVAVSPVGGDMNDQVFFETTFDPYTLSSNLMMDVAATPNSSESEMIPFNFLDMTPTYLNTSSAFGDESFDYINFETFAAALMTPNEQQLMCEQP